MKCFWAARALVIAASLPLSMGCGSSEAKKDGPQPTQLEPKKQVTPPPNYEGPIDPEWPPRHPTDVSLHLQASRLLRSQAQASAKTKTKSNEQGKPEVVVPSTHKGVHVEAGKIGAFSYLEVILGDIYSPDDAMPLVVLLHGRGGRASVPQGPFRNDVPIRLFIPQAPDPLGDGFTWLATWTNSGKTQLLTRSLSARADQLAPAIEAFSRMRPTLGKPILVGFSQGGIMSFTLATRYPKMFSAAFPIAGWLPPALYPEPRKKQKFKYPYIYA